MYRSEYLYNNIDQLISDEEVFPICVPSYNRPQASFLRMATGLPVILFVRREQYDLYKEYHDKYRIVVLDNVTNIGETRAAIVNWAWENHYNNIFMLDDDIYCTSFTVPSRSSTSDKEFMRMYTTANGLPYSVNIQFFKMWIWLLRHSDEKVTMSGPGAKSDRWNISYKNACCRYNSSSVIQCIHLNIEHLKNNNLNYRTNTEVGAEDYVLQYDIMNEGLYSILYSDLIFCVPGVGGVKGGNTDNTDLIEKYNKFIQLFFDNVLDKEHEDKVTTKVSKGGIPSVKFNWARWRVKDERMNYTIDDINKELNK